MEYQIHILMAHAAPSPFERVRLTDGNRGWVRFDIIVVACLAKSILDSQSYWTLYRSNCAASTGPSRDELGFMGNVWSRDVFVADAFVSDSLPALHIKYGAHRVSGGSTTVHARQACSPHDDEATAQLSGHSTMLPYVTDVMNGSSLRGGLPATWLITVVTLLIIDKHTMYGGRLISALVPTHREVSTIVAINRHHRMYRR